jgi:putative protease
MNYNLNARWFRELSMFSSRGYTTGMFFGKQADEDYNFDGESYRMSHELVGVILEIDGNMAKVGLRNRLDLGDTIEYLTPGIEEELFIIESMKDKERMEINSARNEDIIFIQVPKKVRENDLIRRKKDFSSVHHKVIQSMGERQ